MESELAAMRDQYELLLLEIVEKDNPAQADKALDTTSNADVSKLIEFEKDDHFEDAFVSNRLVLNGCHLTLQVESLSRENL